MKLTKIETLPTSENSINETQVKYFHSLEFQFQESVDCYCKTNGEDIRGAKAESTILRGGTLDREFYMALTHEISVEAKIHRGITLLARFDTDILKKNTHVIMLTLLQVTQILYGNHPRSHPRYQRDTDLIKTASKYVKKRIIALTALGVKLDDENEEQVKFTEPFTQLTLHLNTLYTISNLNKVKLCKTKNCKHPYLGSPQDGTRRKQLKKTADKSRNYSSKKKFDYMTNQILHLFFRYTMTTLETAAFSSVERKTKDHFPPNSPALVMELGITKELIKIFQSWRANISEEQNIQESYDILWRYINRSGSRAGQIWRSPSEQHSSPPNITHCNYLWNLEKERDSCL